MWEIFGKNQIGNSQASGCFKSSDVVFFTATKVFSGKNAQVLSCGCIVKMAGQHIAKNSHIYLLGIAKKLK